MPAAAFALALGSAFLHALWNVLLARDEDPEAATGVAMAASVIVFAPGGRRRRGTVDRRVWPFVAVTATLQLDVLRAARHGLPSRRAVVRLPGGARVGAGDRPRSSASSRSASARRRRRRWGSCSSGSAFSSCAASGTAIRPGSRSVSAIASVIAAYTLVDKHGIAYASPLVYLELGMVAGGARVPGIRARAA